MRLVIRRHKGSKEMTAHEIARIYTLLPSGKGYYVTTVAREFGVGVEQMKREFEKRVQSGEMEKIPIGRIRIEGLKNLFSLQDVPAENEGFLYFKKPKK